MRKELRFTQVYFLFYRVPRLAGAVFAPIALVKYSAIFREARMIIRTGMWSTFVRKIGKGSKIDENVSIRYNPRKLTIGNYTHIDVGVQLEVHNELKIGSIVHVAPNAYIQSGDNVTIEEDAVIANGAKIYSKSNTYVAGKRPATRMSSNAPLKLQKYKSGPVHIRKNAFIGMNSVVLPGVTIGENTIIGANAVVTSELPANVVAIGIAAKVVKRTNKRNTHE